MKRFHILLVICSVFCSTNTKAQDVWLQNHFSPNSGCSLSNMETVTVLINNNSGVTMPSNTIQVYYQTDGGTIVNQPLSSNLTAGASWNFSFSTKANLSACGSHVMKVWVARPGDVNHLNDTIQWSVQNDCPVVPGTVINDALVCQDDNTGLLSLTGWSYGTISRWESSTNEGNSWNTISNTLSTYTYTNVSQNTLFRTVIDGGYCPDANSSPASITTQAQPLSGTIAGSDSLCEDEATGILTLSGNTGSVLQWEQSTDEGNNWEIISNTDITQNYALTSSTIFRALIDGDICPNQYSDTALIYVDSINPPAVLTGNDTLCIDNASGIITASGINTAVVRWECSTDNGGTWTPIANTTNTHNYNSLTETSLFRLITDGGKCEDVISDTITIVISPCLGLEDKTALDINIHPNPSNGLIYLDIKKHTENALFQLQTSAGQTIFTSTITPSHSFVDVSNFAKGIYYVHVTIEGKTSISKLILQ